MSKQTRSYVIRLSSENKKQLERDLMTLGVSGEKSLRQIQKATKPANAGLKKTDKAARGLKEGLRSVAQELPAIQRLSRFLGTTALAGGFVAFGKSSLDVARLYQASMKRVEGVTRATAAEMGLLDNAAREMGATTAFTASQAADAIETLAKNGLSVSQILDGALDATLSMASALGAELAPSADLVTDLMNQFKLEAQDLPRIADAVTGAALNSKFGFDDLRLAIGQAGGVAGKFNVDMGDLLTGLAATSSAFASGSDAGTSFKNFLQRLTPASKEAAALIAELGLEFYDTEGRMRSLAEISDELQRGISGLTDAARNDALQTIFGTDAIRTALALADIGGDGFRDMAQGIDEVSAADQAEVRLQGLDGALKEVSAAWEALQLEAAQNGGLDIAEATVDRLTQALRYLTENFPEVEEAVSRVARSLAILLIGRGIRPAIAMAVSMKAAYIELAGSVTGVGTAASRSLGPLTRLAVAGRALAGVMGGPLSLAITALSLISLGVDADRVADALSGAEVAGSDAAEALHAYTEASRKAAEEQEGLEGKVSATTAQLVKQGRAAVQTALAQQKAAQAELLATAQGEGLLNPNHLGKAIAEIYEAAQEQWVQSGGLGAEPDMDPIHGQFENFGPVFTEIAEALDAVRTGDKSFAEIAEQLQSVAGAGGETIEAIALLEDAMTGVGQTDLDTARENLKDLAALIGGFDEQLKDIGAADSEFELIKAYERLRKAMKNAAAAGQILRDGGEEGILGLVGALAQGEIKVQDLIDVLREGWEVARDKPEKTYVEEIADDADRATRNLGKMISAHRQYAASRSVLLTPESSKPLIGQVANAQSGAQATAQILRHFEGFRATPYWDVNANRVGYGSDTITLADGTVRSVTEGMRVSVADANRDLFRRIEGLQQTIIGQIGPERYGQLTPAQQGAIGSVVYNYGEGEFSNSGDLKQVVDALRNGTNADIATAIRGLAGHNGGVNAGRRATEADVFTNNVGVSELAARTQKDSLATAEQKRRTLEAQEKAIRDLLAAGSEQEAQLRLEISLVGKSASEQARLTYIHQALSEAKAKGIDVETQLTASGEKLIDVIRLQADAIGARTAEHERAGPGQKDELQRLEESKDAIRSAFEHLKPDGEGIEAFWDELLGRISDKLWDLTFDPVWDELSRLLDDALGSVAGGGNGGGLLGRLFRPASLGAGGVGAPVSGGVTSKSSPLSMVNFQSSAHLGGLEKGGEVGAPFGAFPPPKPSDISFKIVNKSSTPVQGEARETTGPGGQRQFELAMADAVGQAMVKPGGGARRRLRNDFGLRPRRPLR
jgi:TP901 family phage tail tape measure protein